MFEWVTHCKDNVQQYAGHMIDFQKLLIDLDINLGPLHGKRNPVKLEGLPEAWLWAWLLVWI